MTIASQLPIDYEITIVGKHLPGDDMHLDYTSQWAGAIWLGVHDCSPREQAMQLDALAALWRIAGTDPESSARRITMHETMDYGSVEDVWYRSKVPNFRMISPSELPKGAKWGMQWDTVVITPPIFLRWLQIKLEKRGVVFKRLEVRSLADLKDLGHEVLINASGWGSSQLLDVQEKRLVPIKQQNIRVRKSGYNRLFIRRGDNGNYYSTAFSRADGTIYIGGVKTVGVRDFKVNEDARRTVRETICLPETMANSNRRSCNERMTTSRTFSLRQTSRTMI